MPAPDFPLIAQTTNPDGRIVGIDADIWNHVLHRHPEMEPFLTDVMTAVAVPEHREPDPRPGRERYFSRGGPRRWLRVVTEFASDMDLVVTAFPQTSDPHTRSDAR